jgi:hypothetical protein
VWKVLEEAQAHLLRQPELHSWAHAWEIERLGIDLIYDEYRQRPLVASLGVNWAGKSADVAVFRESWVEAGLSDELARAWVFLVINEALDALSHAYKLPFTVRVPSVPNLAFPFKRIEVRGAVAKPKGTYSRHSDMDAWLRAARLCCDALNDALSDEHITSTLGPELELEARKFVRRKSEVLVPAQLIAPSNFADLLPADRVRTVLQQLWTLVLETSGCAAASINNLFTSTRASLECYEWSFSSQSPWMASPDFRHQARWVYRIDASGVGQMRLEVRKKVGGSEAVTGWSAAGPTVKALITSDALEWESDDKVNFWLPHEMVRLPVPSVDVNDYFTE